MPATIEKTRAAAPTGTDLKPKASQKVEKPKLYKVVLLNDDYTPFELVTHVLKAVFKTGSEKAHDIMWTAHKKGRCVIAVYTLDVAETKVDLARAMAAKHDYALGFAIDPED